VVLLENLF